ncbi:MAG: Serine phosphatase RsbU, regulator of sigma subunit [Candidatus Ozemobacter sibiricus]|uniref:Serine phosphatase RsbU, regulator of sigma subunit n=1 Tax=Candidatus Ozemobacter sibiricus TaxID=2268124 RepID=A0A367ZWK4_9BACT|nr:MAG: Serine phosphatase RsbU, regulator of sigma subunit [Candidatus Ozemobacter sibiricus]
MVGQAGRALAPPQPPATATLPLEPSPEETEETVITYLEEAGDQVTLFLAAPLPGWPPSTFKAGLWSGLTMLALALSLAWRYLSQAWSSAALRTKFLGIFGYAVGLPLLGVAVLAQGMLAERQATRIQATFLAAREALLAFDEAFRLEEAETALRFRRVLHLPALAAGHLPEVASHLRGLLDEGWIDRAELRSWETTPLLSLERGRPDPGFAIFTEMMCRNAIQAFVGPGRTRFAHESMVHIMANAVLETPELGFVEITRKPEKLQLFRFGPSLFYWFWTLRRDPTSPWAFLNLTRSHRQAARRYLERHLVRNREFRLVAWDRQTGRWLPAIRSTEGLTALVTGVARTGEDQVARLPIRGRPYLAFAMPGHRLARFDLVALTPEDAILREPRRLKEAIAAGMGLALLAGVLCALLLADSLLVPLENIGQGVQALSRRDSEHRIPVRADDEMGHLAEAFNHMLETIGEIDLAKVVQDCLIPTAFPPPPGYRSDLRLAKVVSIGGTYFDHLVLPDGREMLLTGDVAGVGVGAGLVMAMAKALTFHHFAAQGEPEALLPRMGHTFMELIPTRRMMSMCLVCLDPVHHTFQAWSAGHAPPLLWRKATVTIEVHRHPSHPLGFRKIRIGHTPPQELGPGDLLLLYSDEVFHGLEAERPSLEERLAAAAPHGPTAVVQSLADAVARIPPERRDRDNWVIFALQRQEESG